MSLPYEFLDKRPIVLALAGSNGAGKSTFYESFLVDSGLRFINADVLSASLNVSAYDAAELASSLRSALVAQRESFIFETVLSSIKRVAMRVSQGGHDVPDEKLLARFERTQANLKRAIERLPYVIVYSNDDLAHPYKPVQIYEHGKSILNI